VTELLQQHRVLICAGTGGVGKTSMAASLGVLAAQSGLRTLVLTIDPALRLAQALGIDSQAGVEVAVPGVERLWASMIDPRREFDEFVLGSLDKGMAKGLLNNRLYQQLVSNLSGSQEFTSLVRLLVSVRSKQYDLVILDTPPSQNAVDFLLAPERLYALFQESVIGWFSDVGGAKSFMQRTLHRGTRVVTAALEAVTGSTFIHELKDFFSHISLLQDKVARVSSEVRNLLRDSQTGFILVTGFDESKLKEALEFEKDLHQQQLRLKCVIVNRWFPEWSVNDSRWPVSWDEDRDFQRLKEFYGQFAEFFRGRQVTFEQFVAQLGNGVPVIKLPDFKNNVQGLEDLRQVAAIIVEKWRSVK
jgi:anion-transporting  ArsA/GET3 family ATPase